jgi:hypothetical protein
MVSLLRYSKTHQTHVSSLSGRAHARIQRVIRTIRFPLGFRPTGLRFLSLPVPAGELSPPYVRPTCLIRDNEQDPDGVSMFRTYEMRAGRAPPIVRERAVPSIHPQHPADALDALQRLVPVTALLHTTDGLAYDGPSSEVHSRSPVRSSSWPVEPRWSQLSWASCYSASHPAVTSGAREREDRSFDTDLEVQACYISSTSHFIQQERLHVALVATPRGRSCGCRGLCCSPVDHDA